MINNPRVSVIIAAYNWSSVLHFAIQSVLWQTIQDFEVLIVGDACTDDSADVVAAFNDSRLRWHNLPLNSGSQSEPNNAGLQMARADYIAYLGQDDLWHPEHLAILLNAIQNADLAYAIAEIIFPASEVHRNYLTGVSPAGHYEYPMLLPPSSVMHRRDVIDTVGLWKDYRTIAVNPDMELILRIWAARKRFQPGNELTVFKFPSAERKDSYRIRASHEQAEYTYRIQSEPDFRYRELLRVMLHTDSASRFVRKVILTESVSYGTAVAAMRAVRGLDAQPLLSIDQQLPIATDLPLLTLLNQPIDIIPPDCSVALHARHEIPEDGLFIGLNWHPFEENDAGIRYRWVQNDAQIVITRPTGACTELIMTLASGPGVAYRILEVEVRDTAGAAVAHVTVIQHSANFEVPLPLIRGEDAIFTLHTEQIGQPLPDDPRIMNFRVERLGWADGNQK